MLLRLQYCNFVVATTYATLLLAERKYVATHWILDSLIALIDCANYMTKIAIDQSNIVAVKRTAILKKNNRLFITILQSI